MNRWLTLIGFLVVVIGGGLTIGYVTAPGEWYAGLAKPWFTPPGWVFGAVWTLLYVLIAVAGWRIFVSAPRSWSMGLWWVQLGLNFLWSPVFFAAHRVELALVVILLLMSTILAFIAVAWRYHREAAWMFLPYTAWVAFASVLNGSIWVLN